MIEIIPNWHPVFVHYTIALLSVSTLLYLVGRLADKDFLITAARWNLWLGALITIGTISAGLIASGNVAHDADSHAVMMNHRNWALGTASVFLLLAGWAYICREQSKPSVVFLVALLLATAALGTTGYKGGELVYRHGVGVMSLPETSAHDHGAHNGDAHNGDAHNNENGAVQNIKTHDTAPEQEQQEQIDTRDDHADHDHAH